jgi:hypothetical protein
MMRATMPVQLLLLLASALLLLASAANAAPEVQQFNLTSMRGCSPKGAAPNSTLLAAGLNGDCSPTGTLSPGGTVQFLFEPPPRPTFNMLVILRLVNGHASMQLRGPDGLPVTELRVVEVYATASASEHYLFVPAGLLGTRGTYTIEVQRAAPACGQASSSLHGTSRAERSPRQGTMKQQTPPPPPLTRPRR